MEQFMNRLLSTETTEMVCTLCGGNLTYVHDDWSDYLVCTLCNEVYDESEDEEDDDRAGSYR